MALPSKDIWDLRTSHHLHCHHATWTMIIVLPGLPPWLPAGFHPALLQPTLNDLLKHKSDQAMRLLETLPWFPISFRVKVRVSQQPPRLHPDSLCFWVSSCPLCSSYIPRYTLKNNWKGYSNNNLYMHVHSSIFQSSQKAEPKCPSVDAWINKMYMVHLYNGLQFWDTL